MAANVDANLANWSTSEGSNQPDGTDSADIDAELRRIQAVVRKYLAAKGSDIASAATIDLATATGNYVHITGSTGPVTSLGTVSAGLRFLLVFDSTPTLTHNGTSLILPSAANIVAEAGDRAEFVSLGSGNWRCMWYQRASNLPTDATLLALAGWANGTNKIPYTTSTDTVASLDFKDEDDMASNSATALPSQQSVKAYADTKNIATQVAPGTSGNILTSNGSAWTSAAPTGVFSAYAETAKTTVPAASGLVTVAHGLGAIPKMLSAWFECQDTELNWSASDTLMNPWMEGTGTYSGALYADSTNVYFRVGGGGLQLPNKTTGTAGVITPSKWKIFFKCAV